MLYYLLRIVLSQKALNVQTGRLPRFALVETPCLIIRFLYDEALTESVPYHWTIGSAKFVLASNRPFVFRRK